jgi:hypothetical protein
LVDNHGEADDAMLVDDPVPELVRLPDRVRKFNFAIDELREQIRSLQISTNETAPAATSTQSMDDRVLVSALSEPFVVMDNISGFIPPFSLSDALMVRVPLRYASPSCNSARWTVPHLHLPRL